MLVNCSHFEIIALNKSVFWISVCPRPVYATQSKCLKLVAEVNHCIYGCFCFLMMQIVQIWRVQGKFPYVVGRLYFR